MTVSVMVTENSDTDPKGSHFSFADEIAHEIMGFLNGLHEKHNLATAAPGGTEAPQEPGDVVVPTTVSPAAPVVENRDLIWDKPAEPPAQPA